jgi:hypothetical protein
VVLTGEAEVVDDMVHRVGDPALGAADAGAVPVEAPIPRRSKDRMATPPAADRRHRSADT